MSELRALVEDMEAEIDMAKHYYKCALFYKDISMEFARKFVDIAKQEINHANILHEMAIVCVKKIEEKGKEATEYMKERWNDAHVEMVDELKELEYKLSRI